MKSYGDRLLQRDRVVVPVVIPEHLQRSRQRYGDVHIVNGGGRIDVPGEVAVRDCYRDIVIETCGQRLTP